MNNGFEMRLDKEALANAYPISSLEMAFANVIAQITEGDYLPGKWSNIKREDGEIIGAFRYGGER